MKLGFYGFGHLAGAVTEGLLQKELCTPQDIFVLAKSEQTKASAKSKGFTVCTDGRDLASRCDLLILAVKPAVFKELAPTLAETDMTGKRVVSLMASIGLAQLKETFSCPVLRVMPTIAIKTGEDIIGMTDPACFSDVKALFEKLGTVHLLDEEHLDRLTVTASCGPGFAAKILGDYALSCQKLGFSKEQANAITAAIFSFAAITMGFI